jgi:myo-inositol 2-dehydrogenase/D-chiro-inositol 1-dehydrogenase
MSEPKRVRIALVGAGRIGSIRAELIAKNTRATLEYIVDLNLDLAKTLASRYGSKFSSNLDEVLPFVDAVWISVYTELHPKFIKQVACHKLPVATEKPVAFTEEEINECFDACEKNSVPFHVGFQRRLDPHFVKFKEALEKNRPAHIIRIVNRDHPLPLPEHFAHLGSIFADFLIHDFDTSLWLMDEAPSSVYAAASQMMPQLKGTSVLDTCVVTLSFKSGTQISIEANRYSPGGLDQRLEAITGTATILANNPLRTEVEVINSDNYSKDIFNYSFPQRYYQAYSNEINHFIDMIQNNAKPKVTRNDCLMVTRIIQAASQSHDQKRVIQLNKA